jgi:hypothetical protein
MQVNFGATTITIPKDAVSGERSFRPDAAVHIDNARGAMEYAAGRLEEISRRALGVPISVKDVVAENGSTISVTLSDDQVAALKKQNPRRRYEAFMAGVMKDLLNRLFDIAPGKIKVTSDNEDIRKLKRKACQRSHII